MTVNIPSIVSTHLSPSYQKMIRKCQNMSVPMFLAILFSILSVICASVAANILSVNHGTSSSSGQQALTHVVAPIDKVKNVEKANAKAEGTVPPLGKYKPTIYVVDSEGEAGFQTIQSAINASNHDKEVIILIKPGIYREKLYIARNNLTLIGSSQESTIVKYPQARNDWRAEHPTDWGAAVINIDATNITLVNLSVINNYGRLHQTDTHQFAIRGFENTDKVIFNNCTMIADGADTVSLWNKSSGKYYHSYCHFEGYTDMVCPRGTALIEHSSFYNHKQTATLWHDGALNEQHKLVVSQSRFDGVEGFWLGRRHYDAQFFLLDSELSERMADLPIFRKTYPDTSRNRANLYGDRYYFSNINHPKKYVWLTDNLPNGTLAEIKQKGLESFTFGHQWQPSATLKQLADFLKHTDLGDFHYQPISGVTP